MRKDRPARSRPGISSARNVTLMPGRAHTSPAPSLDARRFLRRLFFLIKSAPRAPSDPAATTKPPITRLVFLFIGFFFRTALHPIREGLRRAFRQPQITFARRCYSHKGSRRAVIVGKPLSARSAFSGV